MLRTILSARHSSRVGEARPAFSPPLTQRGTDTPAHSNSGSQARRRRCCRWRKGDGQRLGVIHDGQLSMPPRSRGGTSGIQGAPMGLERDDGRRREGGQCQSLRCCLQQCGASRTSLGVIRMPLCLLRTAPTSFRWYVFP